MKVKKILIMFIALVMCANTVTLANGLTRNIDAVFNSVNLTVNGSPVYADNILYNGTTYVPLRTAAEMLGCTVKWDDSTKTASINKSTVSESKQIAYSLSILEEAEEIYVNGTTLVDLADYTLTYSYWCTPMFSDNQTAFDYLTDSYNRITSYKKILDDNKDILYFILDNKTDKKNIDDLYYNIQLAYENLSNIYSAVNYLATYSQYICTEEVFARNLASFGANVIAVRYCRNIIYNDLIEKLYNI